jgi:hypothetical protein
MPASDVASDKRSNFIIQLDERRFCNCFVSICC